MARDFPGTDEYLNVGDVSSVDITGTALSIACWVYADAFAAQWVTKSSNVSTTRQYMFYTTATGKLEIIIGDAAGTDTATGATTMSTGTWYHVGCRKNGTGSGALQVFLSGTSDGSVTSNRSIQNTSHSCQIGARTAGSAAYLNGRMAEVAMWDVALADEDFYAMARGFAPSLIRPDGLRGYWPIIGNVDPEPDLVNGAGGTVTGGTLAAIAHPRILKPSPAIYLP